MWPSRLAGFGALASGALYLLLAVFITSDVLTRRYLNFSTQATDEISNYVLAAGIAWSLAYAFFRKDHVRIDFITQRFSSPNRGYLYVFALVVLNIVVGVLVWQMWVYTIDSFVHDTRSNTSFRTPVGWPQLVWVLGFTAFQLVTIAELVRSLWFVAHGEVSSLADRATKKLAVVAGDGSPPAGVDSDEGSAT
jgi:TRAP-type mannitol/chloroaromatic compound transport system permease small subunit